MLLPTLVPGVTVEERPSEHQSTSIDRPLGTTSVDKDRGVNQTRFTSGWVVWLGTTLGTGKDGNKGEHTLRLDTLGRQRPVTQPGDGFDSHLTLGATDSESAGAASGRRANVALVGIMVAFIALASLIAFKTPAYESADEPSHVQNIETLASGHWYGMNSKCEWSPYGEVDCAGAEAHQAPLYYLILAGWQKAIGLSVRSPYHGQANYPGYPREFFLHHTAADLRFLLWLRLPNVIFGALTVLFTFLAVRLIAKNPWTPVVAASIVAFLPRFVFVSAFVTNDNLVNLLGAILTFAALKFIRAPTGWRMASVGAVLGLLVTTKLSALPVAIVLVALTWLVPGWKHRTELLGVGALTALGVSGWYLIQNAVRYGDPLARAASARYLAQVGGLGTFAGLPYKIGNPFTLVFVEVPRRVVNTFWYQSGWNQFHWVWPINVLFWGVLATALAGLIGSGIDRGVVVVLTAIAVAAFMSVWIVATQTSTYEARYAFVGLAAVAALAALGLERWRLPVRFLLPAMGLAGTLVAIQQNVLAVHWSP